MTRARWTSPGAIVTLPELHSRRRVCADKEAKTMATTSAQEEFLAVIRKSQEAMIGVVRNLAETVRTVNLPKPPSARMPFGDKLPGPEGAVAKTYDFAEQLLASQRKFTEDLLKAKPEGAVARTYDFAEQLLASQRTFAEDLLKAAASAGETYKPGQIVPRDGTVECSGHRDVQDHVKAGTRFAPCSHHHEHSEGCTWQYV
jgi:hypothetical protein